MTTAVALVPQSTPPVDVVLYQEAERARDYARFASSDATTRAYRSDWSHFEEWCSQRNLNALPADPRVVALYLTSLASERKVSTLQRRLSAISKAHKAAGYESPCSMRFAVLAEVWRGIRRAHGTAPTQKAPAVMEDVRAMVDRLPAGLKGIRDRALLLIGFAGAFRRSELVALDVADVEQTREGLVITIRKSKTDQEGKGRRIGIPFGSSPETCPVRALQDWLQVSGITSGALFRPLNRAGNLRCSRLTGHAVATVVKRYARAAGLDATKYSGHSLRAGLARSAAMNGVSERAIMNQTGHRSVNMVRRYIRDGSLFRENAAARVGL